MKHAANLDLLLNQLQNVVIDQVATDPTGTTGRIIYNTTSNTFKYFNGSVWVSLSSAVSQFKGVFTNTTDGTLPGSAATLAGDFWLVGANGTQTGIDGEDVLEVGDLIYAKVAAADQTPANYFGVQTNTVDASTTIKGVIQIATQAEVDAAINSTKAVVPSTLASFFSDQLTATRSTYNLGNGVATTFTTPHDKFTKDLYVRTFLNSTGETIITDVVTTATDVTITCVPAPATNDLRVLISTY